MHAGEVIALIAVLVLSFGFLTFNIVLVSRARQRRLELQADVQSKLIEKFSSASEMVAFLQSRAGRDFVTGVQTGTQVIAQEKVISGFRRSIVVTCLGLAFIAIWMISDLNGFSYPGILLLALGVGYFLASMVSYRFSQELTTPAVRPSSSNDVNA